MYEIEKNVPIPTIPYEQRKYPWTEMEVGDSFFIKCNGVELRKIQVNISSCAKRFGPKKFTVKKHEDGLRCWRVA